MSLTPAGVPACPLPGWYFNAAVVWLDGSRILTERAIKPGLKYGHRHSSEFDNVFKRRKRVNI